MMRALFVALSLSICSFTNALADTYDVAGLNHTLQKYVQKGIVDYQGLARDREALDQYVANLNDLSLDRYNGWSTDSKKAFWLNAYNAIALQQVLNHYPCEARNVYQVVFHAKRSPKNAKDFFSKKVTRIMGAKYSLDFIARVILRVRMHDVRLLLAASPAAKGGPPLRSQVYQGVALDDQLTRQVKDLLGDPMYMRIDSGTQTITLSQLFEQYRADFVPIEDRTFVEPTKDDREWALRDFLADYASQEDKAAITDSRYRISFTKFDWSLNEK